MPVIEQQFLLPGGYDVDSRQIHYTADDLGRIASNTNRMLKNGIRIPIFPYHPEPGSKEGGPLLPNEQRDARDNLGWLQDVSQDQDGGVSYKLDIKDQKSVDGIKNGTIRFTSPEIHPEYKDGTGRFYGPAIRHVALTPKPRNPHQGDMKIVAFSEDTMSEPYAVSMEQFAEKDKKPDGSEGDPPLQTPEYPESSMPSTETNEPMETVPQEEPEISMAITPKSVIISKQISADLESAGISAPTADITKDAEGWLGQLCAALKQKVRTEAEELSKKLDDQAGMGLGVTEESSYLNQFGEDALSELEKHDDPAVREMAKQFSELQSTANAEAASRKHEDMVKKVKESKILPALKEKLLEGVLVEQFSEENNGPTYTLDQVVELLETSVPPGLQFSEDEPAEESHQEGEKFFKDNPPGQQEQPSRTDAKAIVDDLYADQYRRPEPVAS